MNWTLYGYVIASEYRKKIMLCLSERPKSLKEVSKETNLYLSHASSIVNDLVKKGLIECLTPNLKKGKIFCLTVDGKEIVELLKKIEGMSLC
uniref:ArsR family transcriptional regulator n=2 Tax=cellular organisms TaxID=131567 RepID=A0A7C3YPV8_9EURY